MGNATESMTLHSDDAESFRDLKDDLERRLGHRPGNAEAVRMLMAGFDAESIGSETTGIQR